MEKGEKSAAKAAQKRKSSADGEESQNEKLAQKRKLGSENAKKWRKQSEKHLLRVVRQAAAWHLLKSVIWPIVAIENNGENISEISNGVFKRQRRQ
jgi:hypothetical protein